MLHRALARVARLADIDRLGNVALESSRTTTPSFTLALNSLLPGEAQRGHRHNAVAVTLVLSGERCYSLIDGARVDWEPQTVMITPPTMPAAIAW